MFNVLTDITFSFFDNRLIKLIIYLNYSNIYVIDLCFKLTYGNKVFYLSFNVQINITVVLLAHEPLCS